MVTVIEPRNTYKEIGENFGAGLSKGYESRSDQQAIQNAMEKLPQNATARQIIDAVTNTQTYNNEAKQNAISNLIGADKIDQMRRSAYESEKLKREESESKKTKEIEKRESIRNLSKQVKSSPEIQEALGENGSLEGVQSLLKDQIKQKEPETKQTIFDKTLEKANADKYIQLSEDIPKLNDTIKNIDYVEKLSKELGYTGSALGSIGLSKKGKELESVAFTLMEPIIKIFNPSGPIAQQKLKTIQDKYAISSSDAPWTKQAKIDALRRFATQALGRAEQKKSLIEKYQGNPPAHVIDTFDKESDTISDAMIDYDLISEEVKNENLPSAESFKGETITSPEGQDYYSDGKRWVKK